MGGRSRMLRVEVSYKAYLFSFSHRIYSSFDSKRVKDKDILEIAAIMKESEHPQILKSPFDLQRKN